VPCAAAWNLGQDLPKIISGRLTPGVPQRWTVTVTGSSVDGDTFRTTFKTKGKCLATEIGELVEDEIEDFKKKAGKLATLSWTAICR